MSLMAQTIRQTIVRIFFVAIVIGVSISSSPLFAQGAAAAVDTAPAAAPPPIWNGVYSAAQADRGKTVFTTKCERCHTDNRPLTGDMFMLHWEGHTVSRLVRKVIEMMPSQAVNTVNTQDKLDAIAFVLQQNGYPASGKDLSDEPSLKTVKLLPREGPRPMRSGSVAEVVGCLARNGTLWQVTNGTEPTPTALDFFEPDPASMAATASLGTLTFRLMYPTPSPDEHIGKRVRVQGQLIKNAAGDRLNVIALTPIAATCAP
jgi:cytochrome c5